MKSETRRGKRIFFPLPEKINRLRKREGVEVVHWEKGAKCRSGTSCTVRPVMMDLSEVERDHPDVT